jgi:hypothetical protein
MIKGAYQADRDIRPFGDLPTGAGEHGPRRIVSDGEAVYVDDDPKRFIQRGFDDGVAERNVCCAVEQTVEGEHSGVRDRRADNADLTALTG